MIHPLTQLEKELDDCRRDALYLRAQYHDALRRKDHEQSLFLSGILLQEVRNQLKLAEQYKQLLDLLTPTTEQALFLLGIDYSYRPDGRYYIND